MGNYKLQRKPRPSQSGRSGSYNAISLLVSLLSVFVLDSPVVGVLGAGISDGLCAPFCRMTLPNSGTLESDINRLGYSGGCCAEPLCASYKFLSWPGIGQFQSICCRCNREASRTTRSPGFWIILLLSLSGNIHPNPGPQPPELSSPDALKNSNGLRFIHVNVRSLLNKIDAIRLWTKTTDTDILVLSETWLKPSITNSMIHIDGYNMFRTDRANKGGGVAIYVKTSLICHVIEALTKPKFFELCAINVSLPNGSTLTVVGCYRPPSAVAGATALLSDFLNKLTNEYVVLGDLNWDWLSSTSALRGICDALHLTQLIQSPTRLNIKCMDKSTLLDVILTNAPHKYSATGVFCNDVSDHCMVACVRNTKMIKTRPRFVFKRNYKCFNEQAFLHEVFHSDLNWVYLMDDVEIAWGYFKKTFLGLIDKHAPFRRYRVRGRDNPWFNDSIADAIRKRNEAWVEAKKHNSDECWLNYRRLRNTCTRLIKCTKNEHYLN